MGKRIYPLNVIKYWYSYDLDEICQLYSDHRLHKQTVRRWIKEGLPTIDKHTPGLVYGSQLKKFLGKQNQMNKCSTAYEQFYCFKCRDARNPYKKQVQLEFRNLSLQLKAVCRDCKSPMNKGYKLDDLQKLKSLFYVVDVLELYDSTSPTVNAHFHAPNEMHQSESVQLELFR
ncbi:MAG: hypothetical protein IPP74_12945 [Alphaproteobacteria bacterium]|nr:hypothetical protein [Alphaproteobacteria bacterium]